MRKLLIEVADLQVKPRITGLASEVAAVRCSSVLFSVEIPTGFAMLLCSQGTYTCVHCNKLQQIGVKCS